MARLVGKAAPDFQMKAVKGDGSDFQEVKLSDYKGKYLVLFFYPADFTFVCPTEIRGFSEQYEEFKKEGAEVLGVSVDGEYVHKAWINSDLGKLNFPLAADVTKKVATDYEVLIEEDGVTLRGLFIIDPEGVIKHQTVNDNNVGRNVDETLRTLKALKTGGLCPINWEEGDDLL